MAARRPGTSGPQRNHARRYSRHGCGEGYSHGDRRQDQPRRSSCPWYGTALRGRRRRIAHRREEEDHDGRSRRQDADRERRRVDLPRWHYGGCLPGQATTVEPDPNSDYLGKFMGWADEFRGKFGVRANADIPRDAKVARRFGAEGIGLCRTEHMFFAEDRLPFVQAMILASDEKTAARLSRNCSPCSAPTSPACSRRWTDSRW